MTAKRPVALTIVLAALAVGCTSSRPAETGYPAVSASDVTVYQSADEIQGEYHVLSVLPQPERGGYNAARDPLQDMRRAAGRLGANGLLVVDTDDEIAEARIRTALAQGTSFSGTRYLAVYVGAPPAE